VIVTRRPKLACRACPGTVVQTSAPARLIEGGLPTEALVAHVLVSRYADHLPLYRQAQIMARQGVALDRSTLAFWVGYAAAEVAPVVARLREILLASARLFADETVVPVLMGPIAQARWEPRSRAGANQAGLLLGDRTR
jgi:transposase